MLTLLSNMSHSPGAATELTLTSASATLGKYCGEEYGPGFIQTEALPLDEATGFSLTYREGKHKMPVAPWTWSRG